jgi:hypothetical protein
LTATEAGVSEGLSGVAGVAPSATWPVRPPEPVAVIVVVFDAPPATSVRKCLSAARASAGPGTIMTILVE